MQGALEVNKKAGITLLFYSIFSLVLEVVPCVIV